MKHHDALRPIGRCKGCSLNLRRTCAAALEPKVQWSKGQCPSFGNQEILTQTSKFALSGAKFSRLLRRSQALQASAKPRGNGRVYAGRPAAKKAC